jgi:hypothetical protein
MKILATLLTLMLLAGCSNTSRTLPVLIENVQMEKLEIPKDYQNPKLPIPKEDTVISEYNRNNFIGTVKSIPLPPPRPYKIK